MLEQIDNSWRLVFKPYLSDLTTIANLLKQQEITPEYHQVMRVFERPVSHYRAVIVGQDPYPTSGLANGLAFSVDPIITKFPASLTNIFKEYVEDTGFDLPSHGDLSAWSEAGVALINTSLSLNLANKKEHLKIGWQKITALALSELAQQGAIAILWGNHAQLAGSCFAADCRIETVHPSPLSVYRGFFGSKPFTRTNELLIAKGKKPIDWKLS